MKIKWINKLSDEEKMVVKKLIEQFFNQHYYFGTVWPFLNSKKKEKNLEIVLEGKGVIPYGLWVKVKVPYGLKFFFNSRKGVLGKNIIF